MTKRIYLIRHAQAQHNVSEDYHIHDAKLTTLGKSQAASLLSNNPRLANEKTRPEVLFTSPLTRTIETTLLGFKPENLAEKVIPIAELQENSAMPCDTGSDLKVITGRFPKLDFSRVPPDWNNKSGPWEDSQSALSARAQKVRNMLAERKEDRIAIITHGGFCSHLIGTYTRFYNAECREFDLVQDKTGKWIFVPATVKDKQVMKKHVDHEAKEEPVTFAETEMPTKI